MPPNGPAGLRILFAGTPDFAVPALQALIDSGRAPVAVLTQPDRPSGRGRKLRPGPVKRLAESHAIDVLQPRTLKDDEVMEALQRFGPDLMIVAAYGLILPQATLDLPRLGCWNIHASLLPRWRGAAPVQRAIEAGDAGSGVCIMRMEASLDTGPVYLRRETALRADETGGSLHDRLAQMGAEALLECLDQLEEGALPEPEEQDHAQATYARKLDKAEACIDWSEGAAQLERRVRAFNPWPVAWCELDGERLRVWRAEVAQGTSSAQPGSILAARPRGIDIATGDGILRLLEVQRPGSRKMPVSEFLKARTIRTST